NRIATATAAGSITAATAADRLAPAAIIAAAGPHPDVAAATAEFAANNATTTDEHCTDRTAAGPAAAVPENCAEPVAGRSDSGCQRPSDPARPGRPGGPAAQYRPAIDERCQDSALGRQVRGCEHISIAGGRALAEHHPQILGHARSG